MSPLFFGALVVVLAWLVLAGYIWACFLADRDLRNLREEPEPEDEALVRRLQPLHDWQDREEL